ncbi:hypothetical protein [Streptomyces sp. NPDC086519]|uniref:hypothetical protein n=1 Tax=Streptomyces sp. NPDC086519 TaxID=3154863 RepID=UPI00343165EE
MIAQRQIAAKSNEFPAFGPLLDQIDLRVVVTVDAMHTQRAHAEHAITVGSHYLVVAEDSQKRLRKQLRRLLWKQIPRRPAPQGPDTAAARSAA